ncbi:glycerophosphodiester phosphodiesterase [Dactylosporangium sp. CA-233914]|uniref:glycerophosphodiester phosphodiesterase n=1 Tax=Dactylosporangium sp. CA-233914 TaxID=3239934 RepID=UPI003D8C72DD
MVNVIAHRGFSAVYPENTLTAFRAAMELAVESIEFDVHLTADDELVVIHDHTLDRTTSGTGAVSQLTLEDIQRHNAAAGFDLPAEPVPTLGAVLDLLGGRTRLNINVKPENSTRKRLIDGVVKAIGQRDLADTAYIAGEEESLRLARQLNLDAGLCNLDVEPAATLLKRSVAIGCELIQPGHAVVSKDMVTAAHEAGVEVNVFWADEPAEMRRLISMGVDSILTNRPDVLIAVRKGLG